MLGSSAECVRGSPDTTSDLPVTTRCRVQQRISRLPEALAPAGGERPDTDAGANGGIRLLPSIKAVSQLLAFSALVCVAVTSAAFDMRAGVVYTTDQGLEPNRIAGSPRASSRVGTAQMIPGSPARLLSADDSPRPTVVSTTSP